MAMTTSTVPVPGLPNRTVVSGGPMGYDVAFNDAITAQAYIAANTPTPANVNNNTATNTPVAMTTGTGDNQQIITALNPGTVSLPYGLTPMEVGIGLGAAVFLYFMFSGKR